MPGTVIFPSFDVAERDVDVRFVFCEFFGAVSDVSVSVCVVSFLLFEIIFGTMTKAALVSDVATIMPKTAAPTK